MRHTANIMNKIYQIQLDGVPVGQYLTFEDAVKGVNAEIHYGTDPLSLHIEEISNDAKS